MWQHPEEFFGAVKKPKLCFMGYFTVWFLFIIIILNNEEMIINDNGNKSP